MDLADRCVFVDALYRIFNVHLQQSHSSIDLCLSIYVYSWPLICTKMYPRKTPATWLMWRTHGFGNQNEKRTSLTSICVCDLHLFNSKGWAFAWKCSVRMLSEKGQREKETVCARAWMNQRAIERKSFLARGTFACTYVGRGKRAENRAGKQTCVNACAHKNTRCRVGNCRRKGTRCDSSNNMTRGAYLYIHTCICVNPCLCLSI